MENNIGTPAERQCRKARGANPDGTQIRQASQLPTESPQAVPPLIGGGLSAFV